jgi:hypothetical protein
MAAERSEVIITASIQLFVAATHHTVCIFPVFNKLIFKEMASSLNSH